MGNTNNCFVPENDMNNQYLLRQCCYEFSAENFSEPLAKGRLTKVEVEDTLRRYREHIGGGVRKPITRRLCILFFFILIMQVCGKIWGAVFRDDDDKDSLNGSGSGSSSKRRLPANSDSDRLHNRFLTFLSQNPPHNVENLADLPASLKIDLPAAVAAAAASPQARILAPGGRILKSSGKGGKDGKNSKKRLNGMQLVGWLIFHVGTCLGAVVWWCYFYKWKMQIYVKSRKFFSEETQRFQLQLGRPGIIWQFVWLRKLQYIQIIFTNMIMIPMPMGNFAPMPGMPGPNGTQMMPIQGMPVPMGGQMGQMGVPVNPGQAQPLQQAKAPAGTGNAPFGQAVTLQPAKLGANPQNQQALPQSQELQEYPGFAPDPQPQQEPQLPPRAGMKEIDPQIVHVQPSQPVHQGGNGGTGLQVQMQPQQPGQQVFVQQPAQGLNGAPAFE